MTTRPIRSMVLALAVAITLVAAAGTPASASPGGDQGPAGKAPLDPALHAVGLTPAALALMKAQGAVDRVADRIQAAAVDVDGSGLSGIVVDPAHQAVKVYWHGSLSAAVSREITTARAGGVTVTVSQAPYLLSQLTSEAHRLVGIAAAQPGTGARVVSAAPMPDGSGLDVGTSGTPAGATTAQATRMIPYLSSTVAMTVTAGVSPQLDSRQADTTPYWGGALITQGNVACSSGFGVTGNNGAATYILTAAHCGAGTWSTGAGVTMGSTIPVIDWTHDAELILTSAGSAVYDGDSIAGTNQFSKFVAGSSASHVGDGLCTSGSFSGAVCGISVVRINEAITFDGHPMTLVRAEQGSHVGASGSGDSGGPVFSLTNGNADDVAHGTLTGHDTTTNVACRGVPTGNGRTCGWRFWFPDITLQANAIGFHVNVG